MPPILQELGSGVETYEVNGHTVGECLESLERQFPKLKDYLFDRQGRLLGIFGITLMTLSVVYGVSHMPIYRSSVILLFEIVIGAASAVWIANETIRGQEWWGGSLVILAAYLAARSNLHEENK